MTNNKKHKMITIILTVVLTLALIASTIVVLIACRDLNIDLSGNNETVTVIGTDANGNDLIAGKVYPLASSMTLASAGAYDTGITLSATVMPTVAYDKTVDWLVAWQDDNSTWASGKSVTNYLTVTPTSDGATTATLNCYEAFGEKIEITVTSRSNPEANAACTVDYAKRVTGVSVRLFKDSITYMSCPENEDTLYFDYAKYYNTFEAIYQEDSAVYSEGTMPASVRGITRMFYYSDEYRNYLTDLGYTVKGTASFLSFPSGCAFLLYATDMTVYAEAHAISTANSIVTRMIDDGKTDMPIAYVRYANGGDYGSYTKIMPVKFKSGSTVVLATGIILDESLVI